ncbi:hypothetical protein N7G274_005690 [Stereocaulon virgatum]|uniref:Uncharacterized protein n=1 Tax=Stereocaulon virgatum TaxID=373712 RepID=A0ABR4A6J2_9LECA
MKMLQEDVNKANELDVSAYYKAGYAIKGWDGEPDRRHAAIFQEQATFHPTMYMVGVLKWLAKERSFECYTQTRMIFVEEKHPFERSPYAVEATYIPLQKLSIVAQLEYHWTYCIAIRVPKGIIENCLINDQGDPNKCIRFTACDAENDYLVIGGCDHKAGSVDYRRSGHILDFIDLVSFVGLSEGLSHTYVVTGDTGHGLTLGVLAAKLIVNQVQGIDNPWAKLYNQKRLPPVSSLPSLATHGAQINTQYKRFLHSEIADIEDLAPGSGGVLNATTKKPLAVFGTVPPYAGCCMLE